jgi:ABC-2 type transport system permease protein
MGEIRTMQADLVRLLAVVERDLKKFRRNPMVLAMSILMPIIYLLILGNSFQGKLQGLPLVVVNRDPGLRQGASWTTCGLLRRGRRHLLFSRQQI